MYEPVTVQEVLQWGWSPPQHGDRVQSLTQIRDFVILLTYNCVYKASRDALGETIQFSLVGHF